MLRILRVVRWFCRLTDLTLDHVIDNRQTALSENKEVSLRSKMVFCIIASGSKQKVVVVDGT